MRVAELEGVSVGGSSITLTDDQKAEFYRSFTLGSLARLRLQLERMNPDYKLPPPRPRQTTMGTPSGRGPATYAGKHLVAGALVDDTLTVIDGWPAFADYATDWEKKWSVLCDRQHQFPRGSVCHPDSKESRATFSPYHAVCARISQFTPVVATTPLLMQFEFATVTGHIGTVSGRKLVTDGPVARDLAARPLSEEDGQVFVLAGERKPDGWSYYGNDEQEFTVFTTLTGQVSAILSAGATGFVEKPLLDPIDLIDVGRLLVKLGAKGGSKLVTVAFRKRAGKAAPTALAEATGRVVGKAAVRAADEAVAAVKYGSYSRDVMGVPRKHFDAMVAAAKETDSIAVFRANKKVAVELIEKGAVGKPKALSMVGFKTDPKTGILTASTQEQIALVARAPDYYLVNAKLEVGRAVTRDGKLVYETINVHPAYWDLQFGQVVHKSGHPVVGDYDLMGVMPVKSPGSAAVGVPKDGLKGDWLGPHVEAYMKKLNPKLDKPRVLHGAQDQFHGPGGGFDDGVAYAVFPDGKVVIMNGRAEQEAFYKAMKRQVPGGSYNPGGKGVPAGTEDIGPGGRRKK